MRWSDSSERGKSKTTEKEIQMNPTAQIIDADTVRFERLLPGPIERVFDHLTKPELRRTWLAGAAAGDITACQPPQSVEYELRDASVVRFDLEPRGDKVLLVLTHRRLPACLLGACTTLIAGLLVFLLDQPAARAPQPQTLSVTSSQTIPSVLKFHSSVARPLYGMLGGRC
jgi:hypothetical protein